MCRSPLREVDPLVKAIWDGNASLVRTMVRAPDLNLLQLNEHGWMPIHEAAYYGQEECLRALLGGQWIHLLHHQNVIFEVA